MIPPPLLDDSDEEQRKVLLLEGGATVIALVATDARKTRVLDAYRRAIVHK